MFKFQQTSLISCILGPALPVPDRFGFQEEREGGGREVSGLLDRYSWVSSAKYVKLPSRFNS